MGRELLPPPPELIRHRPLRFFYEGSNDQTSFSGSDVTIVIPVGAHLDLISKAKFSSDLILDFI